MNEKGPIVFGEKPSTAEMEKYRQKIENARKVDAVKGSDPVGGAPKPVIPDFKKVREQQEAARASRNAEFQQEGVTPRPPGSPLLSPETEAQLQGLAKESKEAIPEVKKEEPKEEEFDFAAFAERNESERIYNNKKRREEIEKRCVPMKFEDLLFKNEVQQTVPIIPGQFEPTFRSITPDESLFIKKILAEEDASSENYMAEKYNICLLTLALYALNGKPLPDHRDNNGLPKKDLFNEKLKFVTRKSSYIIADLSVNYTWFDMRVRKLISGDPLKNG